MKKIIVLVPYNVISLGDKLIGADARFWYSLEKPFRRLLLLKPSEALIELSSIQEPSCKLRKLISDSEQISMLRKLKEDLLQGSLEVRKEKDHEKNPLKLLGLRLASLVVPGSTVYRKLEEEVYDPDIRELRAATSFAKQLKIEKARPFGRTLYLKLNVSINRDGKKNRIVVEDKIYSQILEMDSLFRREFESEVLRCLGGNTSQV